MITIPSWIFLAMLGLLVLLTIRMLFIAKQINDTEDLLVEFVINVSDILKIK